MNCIHILNNKINGKNYKKVILYKKIKYIMKKLKYVKTFESFDKDVTNEEMIPILPGPGALGALIGPFLPFLIAIQSTKAVKDRLRFRKAKRFLGDFFEKIANDPVIKNISDGLTTGSIYPPKTPEMSPGEQYHICAEIRKNEIQKALNRIKEISEEGEYEKFIDYMNYMNNDSDDWKSSTNYWPIFGDTNEIGYQKHKTEFFDIDDTLYDIENIAKKISSKF